MKTLKVILLVMLVMAVASPVIATEECDGKTPGYWKNHLEAWGPTGYSQDDIFAVVFSPTDGVSSQNGITLLDALNLNGGSENALARQAVAALLNASHPDIDYPLSQECIIFLVSCALDSGDKDFIEFVKNVFDYFNNLGPS